MTSVQVQWQKQARCSVAEVYCVAGSTRVEGACSGVSFLLVEDGEVAGDVPADTLDFGELGGAA